MPSPSDFDNCPILSSLAPDDLAHSCPEARLLRFSHRDIIYRQGERGQYVWCLLEGQIILSRLEADGSVVTTELLGAGEFFGHAFGGATEAEDSA
ncbi:MAG: cyclic nucleotide-binding domain-containing protein, partial [Planctomycetes bacterium]|nr:cyclic nucleotide-binding domain-containing protein [Planctomycetota bacterium]